MICPRQIAACASLSAAILAAPSARSAPINLNAAPSALVPGLDARWTNPVNLIATATPSTAGYFLGSYGATQPAIICRTSSGKVAGATFKVKNGRKVSDCFGEPHKLLAKHPTLKLLDYPLRPLHPAPPPSASPAIRRSNTSHEGTVCLGKVNDARVPGIMGLQDTQCRVRIMGSFAPVPVAQVLIYDHSAALQLAIPLINSWVKLARSTQAAPQELPLHAFEVRPGTFLCAAKGSDGKTWAGERVTGSTGNACRIVHPGPMPRHETITGPSLHVYSNPSVNAPDAYYWQSEGATAGIPYIAVRLGPGDHGVCRATSDKSLGVLSPSKLCLRPGKPSMNSGFEILLAKPEP